MNIASLFTQSIERYPDHTALVFGDRRWSYAGWHARVTRFARALAELGVRPTDRVGFYISTSEASVTTYFACQMLGAVAVPINFRLAPGEVAHILSDSGARVLVYGRHLAENALEATTEIGTVHACVSCADDPADVPPRHHHFERLAESTAPEGRPWPAFDAGQLSALVYTSGTTGRPKGVMHSHANDVAIAMNCVMEYGLSHRDTALHVAPLYHVGGMQAYFIPHLMVGGTNVVMGRYEAARTLEAIEGEKITTLFAVPTQIQEMLHHPQFHEYSTKSLRMITTGGAAISAATMERVIQEFCPNIYNGYGMTEASLTLLLQPADAVSHLGSCGKPTLISECRIVRHDPDRDSEPEDQVLPGDVGELIVRGPQMMAGYWNNPIETRRKIHGGWLRTGDLFSRDADGFHRFHGRIDDMIVSGGENVYPREVEETVARCPGVREVAVVGLPDPKWGAIVAAFVVSAEPSLTPEAIDQFCLSSGHLAAFKRPRRISFVKQLPVNPSGKVLRRELIAAATAEA